MTKESPFVLTTASLQDLTRVALAANEPSVVQLVGWYQSSLSDVASFAEMLQAEMEHFGVVAS